MKRIIVAAVTAAALLLFTSGVASAHEVTVVCDESTGELVWSNVFPEDGPVTIVTSNGLTVDLPAEGSVRTAHPGPGTWVATWDIGEFVTEGTIPPPCVESTTTTSPTTIPTTTAPPTTAPPTSPPTSEARSRSVTPPGSATATSTLPETGTDLTAATIGLALVSTGTLVTLVTRRRAQRS